MEIPEVGRYRFTLDEVLDVLDAHLEAKNLVAGEADVRDRDLELKVFAVTAAPSATVITRVVEPGSREPPWNDHFTPRQLARQLTEHLAREVHGGIALTGRPRLETVDERCPPEVFGQWNVVGIDLVFAVPRKPA